MKIGKVASYANSVHVYVAEDAVMVLPGTDLEHALRYGDPRAVRYSAAGCIDSYAYLTSPAISTKEAIRRLRILRNATRGTLEAKCS